MGKSSAFGTVLGMGTGLVQVETATVVGTISGSGNATVTITAANLVGSPLAVSVAVLNLDSASVAAGKMRDALALTAAVTALFDVTGATDKIILTRKGPFANDATLNIATANGTCTGLTAAPTSANTNAGETLTSVAYIKNISGPGLALDSEDVTTHDSTNAWEEVVATVLRTGELSLDIVYDPQGATHNASTGLIYFSKSKITVGFRVTFPGAVAWDFAAVVAGFEPSAPHDGALTAAVKLKITGAPILA